MRVRTVPGDPGREERPTSDEAAAVELSDEQLEHVVGGLERPAVSPDELASLLDERKLGPDL